MKFIRVKENTSIPKYKQIISSVENSILEGLLKKGDCLPSINRVRDHFSLSRDTVLMAYYDLKSRGIIESIAGKGYYIKNENIHISQKVFLLFDELNTFKEDLYNSFLNTIDKNVQVDIFFHHFNYEMFSRLIYESIGNYSSYIIMPANLNNTARVIEKLPRDKVFILDQTHTELNQYAAIYQDFEKDIFKSLSEANTLLKKYKKLILVFSKNKEPQGMLRGFETFLESSKLTNEIINTIENRTLKKGEVYLVLDDRNLIKVIKKIKDQKLKLGEDIGVISYNETLLKEVVAGGITTISTDFRKMGERLAQMITNKERKQIENPSGLIIRKSL